MATDRVKEALQLAISPLAVRHQLRRHLHHPAASLNLHVKEATSLPHPPDDDNGHGHNQSTPLLLPIHLPHVPLFASRLGQTILCLTHQTTRRPPPTVRRPARLVWTSPDAT